MAGLCGRENACEPASQPKANIAGDENVFILHFAMDRNSLTLIIFWDNFVPAETAS